MTNPHIGSYLPVRPPAGGSKGAPKRRQYAPEVEAWGTWLSKLASWDWFGTFTFRPSKADAWSLDAQSIHAMNVFETWVGSLAWKAGLVKWFASLEVQKDRGVPHLHTLIALEKNVPSRPWWGLWTDLHGFASIRRYDARGGATNYVSKYVAKELGAFYWSDNLGASTSVLEGPQSPLILEGGSVSTEPAVSFPDEAFGATAAHYILTRAP